MGCVLHCVISLELWQTRSSHLRRKSWLAVKRLWAFGKSQYPSIVLPWSSETSVWLSSRTFRHLFWDDLLPKQAVWALRKLLLFFEFWQNGTVICDLSHRSMRICDTYVCNPYFLGSPHLGWQALPGSRLSLRIFQDGRSAPSCDLTSEDFLIRVMSLFVHFNVF